MIPASITYDVMTYLRSTYGEDLNVDAMLVEGAVLKTMLKDGEFKYLREVTKVLDWVREESNTKYRKNDRVTFGKSSSILYHWKIIFNSKRVKNLAEIIDYKQTI